MGEYRLGCTAFFRYAAQRLNALAAFVIAGFAAGIAYRSLIDDIATRNPANYLRSGLHGTGIALAAWAVQIGFTASPSPLSVKLSDNCRHLAKSSSDRSR